MITQNLITAHFKKRETALKWLCMSFGYFILFVFLEDPRYVTISLIGKARIPLFVGFCIFYAVSMLANFEYMRRNFEVKSKVLYPLVLVSNLSFGFVATTLMPDKAVGNITVFATVVHWIAGFGNILIGAVASLIFCLSLSKKYNSKKLKAVAITGAVAAIADLLFFVLMTLLSGGDVQKSKNGFLEIVPLFVTYMTLYFINHTDFGIARAQRDEKEKEIVCRDNSVFSAVSFLLLASAFFFFTFYAFVRNPVHFTISMTGVDYPIGFMIVGFTLAFSFACNFILMFRRNGYKNYFMWALALIGSIAILGCVLSPTKLGTDLDAIHSVSALVFFYFVMGVFFLFMLIQSKKNKKQKPFAIGMFVLMLLATAAMITLFVILQQRLGRTGLTELFPTEYIFFCFFLQNHTEYFKESNTESVKKVVATCM